MFLLICCFMYLPLFVGALCLSLFWYALLGVVSSFAIILTRKRVLVALLLLSYRRLVTVNCGSSSRCRELDAVCNCGIS